jgi:hypothetical protein
MSRLPLRAVSLGEVEETLGSLLEVDVVLPEGIVGIDDERRGGGDFHGDIIS